MFVLWTGRGEAVLVVACCGASSLGEGEVHGLLTLIP